MTRPARRLYSPGRASAARGALLVAALVVPAGAADTVTLPAPPAAPAAVAGLRSCAQGDTTYLLDGAGRVRSLTYARLIPDNTLRVWQSYDRRGVLTGARVQWTGFAGRLLDLRGAFNARGQLVKETGYRAPSVTASLRSSLRPLPKGRLC
ncbi:hypothetical protein LAJ19_04195 [Deinococcus taeanensis]|uniref:hypothetical protein n=1 Tax=Deinococcus taeanensis TaxID=2737050 RepID=UPI001CDBBB9A|nr:hypothetical protein [Deinococcus taeanensis]UBV43422.1 hypothetical protein LAJ19_04195 [Deinococcus taeanensis]